MKGKHVLIIGGTRGSGRCLARRLQDEGAQVSVIGRRKPDVSTGRFWSVDLRAREKLREALALIIGEQGPLDHLVFFQRFRGEGDPWDGEMDVSLTATKILIEYFAGQPGDAQGRSVVLVGSNAGRLVGEEQPAGYHVAKAGLEQMARYYAVTLGPAGIRVNTVTPGTVIKEENRTFYDEHKELTELNARITPLGRMGRSEDVAAAARFLMGSDAAFITGQNLIVDGGLSLLWQETLARKLAGFSAAPVIRGGQERAGRGQDI